MDEVVEEVANGGEEAEEGAPSLFCLHSSSKDVSALFDTPVVLSQKAT